jgi:nickel/cobalt exporter
MLIALFLGFLHGLGADHLMAIAALAVTDGRGDASMRARTMGVAVRFAVGHALLLAAGATLVLVLGWNIPVLLERAGEIAGGTILVALGAAGLWMAFTRRVYAHAHPHGDPPHEGWHVHFGPRERHPHAFRHSHVPALVGAIFAVSGLRALTLLTPLGGRSIVELLPLVVLFGVGIMLSMSLFGIFLSRALGLSATARIGQAAAVVTSVASMALGIYWIAA